MISLTSSRVLLILERITLLGYVSRRPLDSAKSLLLAKNLLLNTKMSSCTFPRPVSDDYWKHTHKNNVRKAREAGREINVLLIGDSIIERMRYTTIWREKFQKFGCLNFGIGGDRVENVLWRMENGELDEKKAIKAVVVFVGTNNVDCTPEDIFEGILKLVETIKAKLGDVPVVIPTLLPKGQYPNPYRTKNENVNELLMKTTKPHLHIVSIHENIVEMDGTISRNILHDYLHLTDIAYTKIFEPVHQKLHSLIK